MRENYYATFVDADNLSFHSEQKSEVIKLDTHSVFAWKYHDNGEEVILDFDNVDYLNNSEQVQLILVVRRFLLEEKRVKFLNLKSGIVPEFIYWIQ